MPAGADGRRSRRAEHRLIERAAGGFPHHRAENDLGFFGAVLGQFRGQAFDQRQFSGGPQVAPAVTPWLTGIGAPSPMNTGSGLVLARGMVTRPYPSRLTRYAFLHQPRRRGFGTRPLTKAPTAVPDKLGWPSRGYGCCARRGGADDVHYSVVARPCGGRHLLGIAVRVMSRLTARALRCDGAAPAHWKVLGSGQRPSSGAGRRWFHDTGDGALRVSGSGEAMRSRKLIAVSAGPVGQQLGGDVLDIAAAQRLPLGEQAQPRSSR